MQATRIAQGSAAFVLFTAFAVVSATADFGTEQDVGSAGKLTYRIAEVSDTSFGRARRSSYRVRVSRRPSEDELGAMSRKIIAETPPQNAMMMLFFLPDTDIHGLFTAGRATWAPGGEWGNAHLVRTGDYSRHRLVIDTP